ncbi:MAG: adenosine deaminase [Acidobacteriales bacterium]|nr:adenosine deaminase [Terriglobales bacterium]
MTRLRTILTGWLLAGCMALGSAALWASDRTTPEQRTARYFNSIAGKPPLLLSFLKEMPKGGDLHNHLSGAVYAESLLDYSVRDHLCVDRPTSALTSGPCDASCGPSSAKPGASCALGDAALHNALIDAWSMRNWHPATESGHDHFFATFDKFGLASGNHTGDMLAEVRTRAASDKLQYLELMETADGRLAAPLGAKVGWDDDLPRLRQKLLDAGIETPVKAGIQGIDDEEKIARESLQCGTPQASPGCDVKVRYLYQVLRGLPKQQVFAQMLTGFLLAESDPRFVGLNLVMPEDWYVPLHDFDLHMKMLDYLHSVYPRVHISLHAGELTMSLVPPEELRHHIRASVELGHAERIGHGVDLMNEGHPRQLLKEMAERKTLVEVCLTSNAVILGVSGVDHPLAVYEGSKVPVTLATDDEGVSRSDMTHEYLRAVLDQHQNYAQLKSIARQSLEHAFLPGASLWADVGTWRRTTACAKDSPMKKLSTACETLLNSSERAAQQWKLEQSLAVFEAQY